MLHSKTEFDFPMDFHILIPSNTHTSDNISICIETRAMQNLLKHPSAHIYRYADKILHLPISSLQTGTYVPIPDLSKKQSIYRTYKDRVF